MDLLSRLTLNYMNILRKFPGGRIGVRAGVRVVFFLKIDLGEAGPR